MKHWPWQHTWTSWETWELTAGVWTRITKRRECLGCGKQTERFVMQVLASDPSLTRPRIRRVDADGKSVFERVRK
jgi:hypothetical protein